MRALIALLALAAGLAQAAPLRLAVVYGHNGGSAARPSLRFAEHDAARVAATLAELAGVLPKDLELLQGASRALFEQALDKVAARVAAAHRTPGTQVLLYLYVSSHGDEGRGLQLGAEAMSWAALSAKLAATGADVRVAFIDACNASGMLQTGGRAAAGFDLRADDRLTVAGEAVITSSAANEPSLEAEAYQGSVFTHHLIAALRGAADKSGDGRVSLEETYRYAYARTVEGESGQHPGYGFKLAGHGELFVSSIKDAATVTVPRSFEAVTVSAAESGDRFLEVRGLESRTLALPPGRWELKLWRGTKAMVGRLTLGAGQRISLDEGSLTQAPATTAQLVRLGATSRFCVQKIEGADLQLARELKAALEARPEHGCLEGALPTSLRLSREGRLKIRVVGTVGTRPIDVLSEPQALAADLVRALAGPF